MLWNQPVSSFYVLLVEAVSADERGVKHRVCAQVEQLYTESKGESPLLIAASCAAHPAPSWQGEELCKDADSVALYWKSCPEVTANHPTSGADEALPLHVWSLNTCHWSLLIYKDPAMASRLGLLRGIFHELLRKFIKQTP